MKNVYNMLTRFNGRHHSNSAPMAIDLAFFVALCRLGSHPILDHMARLMDSDKTPHPQEITGLVRDYAKALETSILPELHLSMNGLHEARVSGMQFEEQEELIRKSLLLRNPRAVLNARQSSPNAAMLARLVPGLDNEEGATRARLFVDAVRKGTGYPLAKLNKRGPYREAFDVNEAMTGNTDLFNPPPVEGHPAVAAFGSGASQLRSPADLWHWRDDDREIVIPHGKAGYLTVRQDSYNFIFEAFDAEKRNVKISRFVVADVLYNMARREDPNVDGLAMLGYLPPEAMGFADDPFTTQVVIPMGDLCPLTGYFWIDL